MATMTVHDGSDLGRMRMPIWFAGLAVAAALVGGFLVGHSYGDKDAPLLVQHGEVSLVDGSQGVVCIRPVANADQECYQAPGIGLEVGQQVTYSLSKEAADPSDPGRGNRWTIVYATTQ